MATTEQRLTLEEFLKLPEEKPALEFIDGMVTQKVSPQGIHSTLQARVIERINRFAEPLRLAFAFPELRATFGGFSPVPDIEAVPAATGRVYEPDPAHHDRYQEAQQRHRRYYRQLVAD